MNTYTQMICGNNGDAFEVSNLSSGAANPAQWFLDWATGGRTCDSGVPVNGYTALTHCPVWQAINIIAGDIGQVPIRLVKDEFFDQKQHNAWQLLRVRPNELQTPSVWKETMMQWALIWGNGVSWTPRVGSRITDMIPLRPDCLWPELVAFDQGQVLLYHYSSPTTGRQFVFFPDDVIHIQGLTGDGIWGYPISEIAKNCIGFGLALEKHGNKQFSNGSRPSGVLQHEGKLSAEARGELRREWDAIHGGIDNAGKVAILWEGMKFQAMQMTNVDSQWVEAKRLSRLDAASLFNLPAYKLNELSDSSNRANLEEQNETYKQMTLTRWTNRFDEELRRKVLTTAEWRSDRYRFVWDYDYWQKADIETRTTVVDMLVKATVWNPNEGRKYLGYPPREGGEVYGNPAINPNEPGGEDSPNAPENTEKEPENKQNMLVTAHRDALHDRLVRVLEMESRLLQQAAEGKLSNKDHDGARNFVEWMDGFYLGNGKPPKVLAMFDAIVGKGLNAAQISGVKCQNLREIVQTWALSRRSWLLEACSQVTAKDLPAAVDSLTTSWPDDQATALLNEAMGQN